MWNKQAAFHYLKQYLHSLPSSVMSKPGKVISLYLGMSYQAISSVLLSETHGIQKPIYYISKVMSPPKWQYLLVENFALAIIVVAHKLMTYFYAHPPLS